MKSTSLPSLISTLFVPGLPSSSISIDPHSFGIVESSTAVTIGEAINSPSLPAKQLSPLLTALASSGCPHASWKRTPPHPLPITTGIFPDGHSLAVSINKAVSAAFFATSLGFALSLKKLISIWQPGPLNPVSIPFSSATTIE